MSTSKLRAKPWETSSVSSLGDITAVIGGTNTVEAQGSDGSEGRSEVPRLPSRPVTLKDDFSSHREGSQQMPVPGNTHSGEMFSNGGLYNMPMYGNGYGSMYGNGYGSMYNGGYTSMYGGSHGGMYCLGAIAGNSNNAGITESTQATFHLIESLVGAVNGFAQMLEATYMATHNSFLTMVSVAEQFQYIKEMMGSFFGIFTILKFLKAILYRITGGKLGISHRKVMSRGDSSNVHKLLDEFDQFKAGKSTDSSLSGKRTKRISWKPMLVFLCAVFGFPWLLNKFIAKLQQVQSAGRIAGGNSSQQQQLDINNLQFARARYDFVPENPRIECALKKGDLMAIVSKLDPVGNESQWWKVRTKKGDVGYIPSNYIELISRQKEIDPKLSEGATQSL